MSKWTEIPVVTTLKAMLEEKDKGEAASVESFKGSLGKHLNKLILDTLKSMPQPDSPCTGEATVICYYAVDESISVHIKTATKSVFLADLSLLNKKDIQLESNFAGCKKAEDGYCRITENYREWILDNEWKGVDETSGQGEGKETLSREHSFMVCTEYGGLICFYNDGQSIKSFLENLTEEAVSRDDEDLMITWLKNMEGPYLDKHFVIMDGIKVGIKPHNVNDGYITIGYGHIIQTEDEAKEYGFEIDEKYIADDGKLRKMPREEVDALIEAQQKEKGTGLENKANLPFQEAENILTLDWKANKEEVKKAVGDNLLLNEHKLNALTSLYFNGSRPANKDSLFSKLIALEIRGEGQKELSEEEKQKEAVELLHEAEEKNWYGENQGLVRRRLMEVNIYFNHDYTCYDSLEIEELKDMVGY